MAKVIYGGKDDKVGKKAKKTSASLGSQSPPTHRDLKKKKVTSAFGMHDTAAGIKGFE